MPPSLAASMSVERFHREIMLSAGLQHPNIVPVLHAGELGELPYFVMPFIAGESLRARIMRGPLSVRDVSEGHPLCEAFIEACEQAGLPRTDDFNGASQEGAGYFQLTTRNGRRWSTARGYLKPARKRPNLAVISGALTTRILFAGRRAVGVD